MDAEVDALEAAVAVAVVPTVISESSVVEEEHHHTVVDLAVLQPTVLVVVALVVPLQQLLMAVVPQPITEVVVLVADMVVDPTATHLEAVVVNLGGKSNSSTLLVPLFGL